MEYRIKKQHVHMLPVYLGDVFVSREDTELF